MRTAFRGITQREALLFEGENGWAEWSPFVEYEDDEARTWLAAALDQGFGLKREIGSVNLNATLPAVDGDAIAAVLARFGSFDTVKIKVAEAGQSIEQDLARVASVRALYPEAKIRLDANGGYSVEEAFRVAELAGELDYLEQPCRTIAELAELRVKLAGAKRIAADESVRKVEDPLKKAMDALNLVELGYAAQRRPQVAHGSAHHRVVGHSHPGAGRRVEVVLRAALERRRGAPGQQRRAERQQQQRPLRPRRAGVNTWASPAAARRGRAMHASAQEQSVRASVIACGA